MAAHVMYYLWVFLLIVGMVGVWFTTLFAFPGNWLIVALAALFAAFFPATDRHGLHWSTVAIGVALAVVGEVLELFAGAAGAKKAGASRRSIVLALVGTMIGSLIGATVAIPIPIVGPIVGALGGGALGAFAGAFIGETAIGRNTADSLAAGKGAMVGRLLGTAGKLAVGVVMIIIVAIDALI